MAAALPNFSTRQLESLASRLNKELGGFWVEDVLKKTDEANIFPDDPITHLILRAGPLNLALTVDGYCLIDVGGEDVAEQMLETRKVAEAWKEFKAWVQAELSEYTEGLE
jgi:hypothetical protein